MTDELLTGGQFAAPIRHGNTVTRLTGPGATALLAPRAAATRGAGPTTQDDQ